MHGQNKQPKGANNDHLYQNAFITNIFTAVDTEWKETQRGEKQHHNRVSGANI